MSEFSSRIPIRRRSLSVDILEQTVSKGAGTYLRKPFNLDGTRTFVSLEDESAYTVGFMTGAIEGYRKGYAFRKEEAS